MHKKIKNSSRYFLQKENLELLVQNTITYPVQLNSNIEKSSIPTLALPFISAGGFELPPFVPHQKIKIEKSADGTYISYKTDYATWKEKIKTLTKEQLILENAQNIQYQYKHPIPFTVK